MHAPIPSAAGAAMPDGPLAPRQGSNAHHAVWELLESVTDPEIPVVNLREMGILRAVRAGAQGLEVVITPTYSGCPAMAQMVDDVRAALARAGVAAHVVTQLAPPWSTDWMTPEARAKLRAYGIAPPAHKAVALSDDSAAASSGAAAPDPAGAGAGRVLAFAPRRAGKPAAVHCPQCGSDDTTEVSHFGSTACKALYRCLRCLEPFDYFKPY